MTMIRVIKRNGRVEPLDIRKIQKYTSGSVDGLQNVNQSELELDAHIQFRDKISTKEIQETLIKTAVEKIDVDRPDWTFVASRLFLYDLYHKVSRFTGYNHLRDYFQKAEDEGRIIKGLKDKYDLDELNDYIDSERDLQFTYLGVKTLYDRYLLKDKNNNPIELPQQMFMAIAMFLAQNELNSTYWAKKFYDLLSKFEVMVATPTLSNARTHRSQLSSCYIGSTSDNIEGIFDSYKEMALLSKYGGGIGWDWNQVRGMGGEIAGHKNAAGGTVPFLKITNDVAIAVDQLGCVAKNSFVRVLSIVKTDNFEHNFRKEYQKIDFTNKELIEGVASYASSFAFSYGKFSKNFISSLLFDYIVNKKSHNFLENIYGLTDDQYKKIIGKYKKINKGLPEGFETIIDYPNYAISQDGIIIHKISFKSLSNIIDKKGYVRVFLDKNSIPLHLLLAKQYLNHNDKAIIEHIDKNKLNNRLENLQIISKGWNDNYKKIEKAKIQKHLSFGCKLKEGDAHKFEIKEIITKIIPITDIRIGDLILSYNIKNNTTEYKPVTAKHQIDVKIEDQIKISFDNGNYIITSKWHPFPKLVNKKIVYVRSDAMSIGDLTINEKGKFVRVSDITYPKIKKDFFDLTVKDNNNYFCSTNNKEGNLHLIHNTRKGAIAVYLEPWHIDIKDFLDLKKNSGEERRRAHDLFPALWLNDLFMKRIENDELWTLFDPFDVPDLNELYGEAFEKKYMEYENNQDIDREKISAKGLWKKILISYFETGNPFLTFKDTANKTNPNSHNGMIRSSNLCVTGDTRLATQFGLVRADELEKMNKKIIATYDFRVDGDKQKYGVGVAESIEMYRTKENANIYKISTKDGYEIKATSWHEFYILRDKSIIKVPLKDIKTTDKLLIQSEEGQFGKEGYYELGFLTGIITGGGTFAINKTNQQITCIDLCNEDISKYIDKVIERDYLTLRNPKEIKFSNTKLGKILDEKYNFNKDTKSKVPEFIYKGSKNTIIGYLQGLFTTNARLDIFKNKIPTFSIQLTSINKEFLKEIQVLLSNLGIRSKIYTTEKRGISKPKLNINGRNATKFINVIGFIGEKQKNALKILLKREELGLSQESNKSEKFEVKIEKIEYFGKEDVYDTTQLLNHSLIFNGIITGNCTEIFQNTEPNHYKIKIVYEDETFSLFEEQDYIKTDEGISKKAKDVTALDQIDGKKIYIVEKEESDGKTAVCNLASINLSKINTKEDIERVVPIAIRMLDNVIELNFYPLRKVKDTNLDSRAIGLGVMGEAEMLAKNKIMWGSEEHLIKIDEIMEAVSFNAINSSSNLAIEKGIYPKFKNSNWSRGILPIDLANENAKNLLNRGGIFGYNYDWAKLREKVKKDGIRNGYLMAIAPTSSISILVGTTQAIEPIYKRKWFEENLSGMVPVVVPKLSTETWSYYISAYELNQLDLIKAGAIRQKWIDQGQSLNIFITLDKASGKYLNDIYMNAWKLGLKSTYYLRSQSPESLNQDSVADRSMECLGCQ